MYCITKITICQSKGQCLEQRKTNVLKNNLESYRKNLTYKKMKQYHLPKSEINVILTYVEVTNHIDPNLPRIISDLNVKQSEQGDHASMAPDMVHECKSLVN